MTIETRKLPSLDTRADVTSVDAEKRTFEIMWGVGEKVLRSSFWDGPFYEELSMDPKAVRMARLNSGRAPFLPNHSSYDVGGVLGVIESARIEGGKGYATVRFTPEGIDPEADKIFRKIAAKIIQNVSVGYRTYSTEKIEGVDNKIPTYRAIDWEPYEVSAVAMGADSQAAIRSAPELHEVNVITRNTERKDMEPKNTPAGDPAPAPDTRAAPIDTKAITADATRIERERISGIRAAVRAAKLDEKVGEKLINDGTEIGAARAFVLEELAKRSDADPVVPANIEVGESDHEKFSRGAASALLMRAVPALVRAAQEKKVEGFDAIDTGSNEFRGLSLYDLARRSLERRGVKTERMNRMDLAGRAFTERSGGPYSGTSDFTVILENVMGKILLGMYAITPDTWSRICGTTTVPDFRPSPRYRTGSLSVLDSLAENGEYKSKSIPDGAKTSVSVSTKGNKIAISRQLIINDDMGALSDLLSKLGRAARLSIEADFYALLLQNSGLGPTVGANPFFHSSQGNVNATGSAISVAGIDADRVVMRSQKDSSSNEYLDLSPATLLVPVGLGGQARVINNSAYNHDSTKLQQPNMVQGLFRDIVDTPRLSGTRRYLFADPSVTPAFLVAFLEGQPQAPVIESKDGWDIDGTEMKVRMDYQVQAFDPKGAVTNAGQ